MNWSLNKQPTSDITDTLHLLRPTLNTFNTDCVCNIPSVDLVYDPVNVFVSKPQWEIIQRQTKIMWEGGKFCRHTGLSICHPFNIRKQYQMSDLKSFPIQWTSRL